MPETVNIYNNTGEGFKTENPFLKAVNNIKNGQNTTRKDNCNTPFRMPLFGSRKTTDCNDCEPNTKVLVDNHALYCCYDPYITSKQNKGGIITKEITCFCIRIQERDQLLYRLVYLHTNYQCPYQVLYIEQKSH